MDKLLKKGVDTNFVCSFIVMGNIFYRSKKTYSQKIARIFIIIGFIMLIPPILKMIDSLVLNSDFVGPIYFFIVIFGLVLFAGYISHSRGDMKPDTVLWLWLGTIIFYGVPLVFTLSRAISLFFNSQFGERYGFIFFLTGLSLIWLTAFILATSALVSKIKEN